MDLNALMHDGNAANIQLVITAKDLRDCFESWMNFAIQKIQERDEPKYYTRDELKKLLHVSDPTLIEWSKKGLIPKPIKVSGGKVLYNLTKVNESLESGLIKIKNK